MWMWVDIHVLYTWIEYKLYLYWLSWLTNDDWFINHSSFSGVILSNILSILTTHSEKSLVITDDFDRDLTSDVT